MDTIIFHIYVIIICLLTTYFYVVSEIYYKVTASTCDSGNIAPGEWKLSLSHCVFAVRPKHPIMEEVTVNC